MEANSLRVSLVQSDLFWENPEANRAELEEKIATIKATDVIVLPETFTTAFSPKKNLAEVPGLHTEKWMRQMAISSGALVMGSYYVKEGTEFFNRCLAVFPSGEVTIYNKRHTFKFGGENTSGQGSKSKTIFEYKGWKICPVICYDLRFPVWCRNVNLEYDVMVVIANWPKSRRQAWNKLLEARAIENQAYVVGVNRVGIDQEGQQYAGDSKAISFDGQILTEHTDQDKIITVTLKKNALDGFRGDFPFWQDADQFDLK